MAIKINLMPHQAVSTTDKESQKPLYLLITCVLFIISLIAYIGIYYYNNYFLQDQLAALESQNEAIQEDIIKVATPEEYSKIYTVVAKGKQIKSILSVHFYGSRVYELLEKITVKSVSYNKVSEKINSDRTVSAIIDGEADSFSALTKQLLVFKKTDEIKQVIFNQASVGKSGKVLFTVNLIFDPSLSTSILE